MPCRAASKEAMFAVADLPSHFGKHHVRSFPAQHPLLFGHEPPLPSSRSVTTNSATATRWRRYQDHGPLTICTARIRRGWVASTNPIRAASPSRRRLRGRHGWISRLKPVTGMPGLVVAWPGWAGAFSWSFGRARTTSGSGYHSARCSCQRRSLLLVKKPLDRQTRRHRRPFHSWGGISILLRPLTFFVTQLASPG